MKILILSFYFEPDLSAGSFRATALVNQLASLMEDGSHIDVVTTLPNRYRTFTVEAARLEQRPKVTINRFALPTHRSGMFDQAKAFLAFARQVLMYVKSREYDLVYATSGRLMSAVMGAWVARKKKALLYLDIRDIFVDTIKDVLPWYLAVIAQPFFSILEKGACQRADTVNLVSQGFSEYFFSRYPGQRLLFFPNGIDDDFVVAAPSGDTYHHESKGQVKVLYAGNIGEGQGLHAIIPELAKRMRGRVQFRIIGDGGRRQALHDALVDGGIDNVDLMEPVQRKHLIKAYQDADVLFLHLNDFDAFKKVLPSKLFEYAAMGKPIWAGVSGYAAEFIRSEIDNAVVFHPCDAEGGEQVFTNLKLRVTPRPRFVQKYARASIVKEMARDMLARLVA